jgi:1,4-dihydroxy-6-naphthoate synthase
LGGIVINRKLPIELQRKVNRIMKRSVEYAFENPKASYPFVKHHAQAMEDSVMESHIKLYVNEFTRELGVKGQEAVETLYREATSLGVLPKMREDIFIA